MGAAVRCGLMVLEFVCDGVYALLVDRSGGKKDITIPLYGASLEEIMEWELSQNPAAKLPSIVPKLIDAIKRMDGFSEEGIFRISPDYNQCAEAKVIFAKHSLESLSIPTL